MKQVLLKGKQVVVEEVPSPVPQDKEVLVKTCYSVISSGTERAAVQGSAQGLVSKAITNPQLVQKGLQLIREQGVNKAWQIVRGLEGASSPLGYSLAGEVVSVGQGVTDINPGDPVACGGAQCAHHAGFVAVPRNLLAKIPPGVECAEAAFTTLGAIAMQGLRRASLSFGETVVITGLGLLGLLAVQIAGAAGYRVVALDIDQERVDLARKLGADLGLNSDRQDVVKEVFAFTGGLGADAVVIYAATESDGPVNQAFDICRQKGKVVGVGVFGMHFDREKMYRKELDFLISTSYGPGRYDPYYEEEGIDYPVGYVRWTENRNFQEFLRLLAAKKVQVKPLVSTVFPLEKAGEAYQWLTGKNKSLGILLEYSNGTLAQDNKCLVNDKPKGEPEKKEVKSEVREIFSAPVKAFIPREKIRVAVVGAGGFVGQVHLPNLTSLRDDFHLRAIITAHGHKAADLAKKYRADYADTDYQKVLADPEVDFILLGTRHNLHYPMIMQALAKGKPVFTEKPLCLNREELKAIKEKVASSGLPVYVGFNRRHAPLAVSMKEKLASLPRPYLIHYRVNAGFLPLEHWTQDPAVGGGRIIGEACHFLDFFLFLVEQPVCKVQVSSLPVDGKSVVAKDNVTVLVKFTDGSLANLIYTSLGSPSLPKEYIEVYAGGKCFVLNDYRSLDIYGVNGKKQQIKLKRQEKGWREELVWVADCLKGKKDGTQVMNQAFEAMEVTFKVVDLL
jgi:predicted dehydrogenase/threonine dehydrogenase-like Zn-dependent dehydrogenase